jgi:hypothetical protein
MARMWAGPENKWIGQRIADPDIDIAAGAGPRRRVRRRRRRPARRFRGALPRSMPAALPWSTARAGLHSRYVGSSRQIRRLMAPAETLTHASLASDII